MLSRFWNQVGVLFNIAIIIIIIIIFLRNLMVPDLLPRTCDPVLSIWHFFLFSLLYPTCYKFTDLIKIILKFLFIYEM